jgi:7,8-dihydropterin-6-yl-methyl-4-(beta-D-ribofuranosyl)aminobenzene 5'-phosphate synthase
MQPLAEFGATRDVAITILMDNRADLIVKSTRTIKYLTRQPLLAEHGFAALIHVRDAGLRILWDAGLTHGALLENMRRMKVDPRKIDLIALSHGHDDHTAAVGDVLRAMNLRPQEKAWERGTPVEELRRYADGRRIPLVAHPAAFRERWGMDKGQPRYGPGSPPPRAEWEALGAEVILAEGPYQLGPGCWTTGLVPRRSFERSGRPAAGRLTYREGEAFHPDDIEEDQAIVIDVKDKGLVVLAGCAHSGIVNTVNYAREISGVERVHAVLGGFHLARASDNEIARTVSAIKELQPAMIVPSHCTGFKAQCQFAREMPEQFVLGAVGATYLFGE